ncbi:MAG TPA: ribonuclease III [Lachnospiraceae bacterium]|nr:ribonuclease III [Lachnospiraceae bacterium]
MNLENAAAELEKKLGYSFKNPEYLERALTHSSFANEQKPGKAYDYERLEFLGDAVLELSVSDHLYKTMPGQREGDMTKLRASLVCEPTLAFCAKALELNRYILLGKGEEQTGGRNRDSIVSDVFEAVIGALYLDGGLEKAKSFVDEYVLNDMYNKIEFVDSKTNLQEFVQDKGLELRYELVSESGPAHDREYKVAAIIADREISEGVGKSKKHAEQEAAYAALRKLKSEEA